MKRYIVFFSIVLLVGCTSNPKRNYTQINGFAQGTTYNISYFDQQQRDFSTSIQEILEKVDSSMSLYRENSIINNFNRSEKGMEVDSLLAQVVNLSLLYSTQSSWAFDITVGPLAKVWGFHAKRGEMPDELSIDRLKNLTGPDMISIDGNLISKKSPEVMIDVNAIAQGYTVDLLAEFLEIKGVKDYLVELGGEIRTKGISSRGKNWLVGVDKPVDNAMSGENLQAIIGLSGESLVTSGNYRKFFVREGVKYSHTINPVTGYPVTHSLLSATVIDSTSARADALATAFMVMGVDKAKEWLDKNPDVDAYLIYSNQNGDYEVWMTKGFEKRIVD